MTAEDTPETQDDIQAPLFILSFNHRDELAAVAARAGWRSIAARRTSGIEYRFISSGAIIAVVDARGAFDEGLAAVAQLAPAAEIGAAALLTIVSRRDVSRLDAMINAGATHYLAAPFSQAEFCHALRFAERHSIRLGGGWQRAVSGARHQDDAIYAWQMDPVSGRVRLSETFAKRIGARLRDMPGPHLLRMLASADRKPALAAVRRVMANGRPTAFSHSLRLADGTFERVAQHLRLGSGQGLIVSHIEYLDHRPAREDEGTRDQLTGLGDLAAARRWIETRLSRGLTGFHILIVAITRFEMINSEFGRETGDRLLQTVARLIQRLASDIGAEKPMVARTAGAEFIVGIEAGLGSEPVRSLAERIIDQIDKPVLSGAHLVSLSSRVAVVEARSDDDDATRILRRASSAIAEAHQNDQARVILLSDAAQSEADHHVSLEADLRGALDRGEIELLYQPQVDVVTGAIVGVEALARWRHPRHGELGAVTLFAVAEASDYLSALSSHVQRRAIAEAVSWPEALLPLRLSVNVTAADIARPGFADSFLAMVDECGFPRRRLTVEITESGLIDDLGMAAGLLADLRAGGCRVAIDDFGTGYSSLAYLKALPLDYLKIDKKLAQDIAGSSRDRIVVRGVIDMARSLGLAVIAEGVETEEQLALLAREGCNYYQGYLCAEPLDVGALVALAARSPD